MIAGRFIKRLPARKQFHFLFSELSVLPSMLTPLSLRFYKAFMCFYVLYASQSNLLRTIKVKSLKATRKLTLMELSAFFCFLFFLVLESRMVESDGHTDLNYGSAPHDLCSWTSY